MLKLEQWVAEFLTTQPEYRMGFQKVVATLSSGRVVEGIVVNCEVFLQEGEWTWQMSTNWNYIVAEAAHSPRSVSTVRLIPREPESLRGVRQIAINTEKYRVLSERIRHEASSTLGVRREQLMNESQQMQVMAEDSAAEDSQTTLTVAGEIFKRFSAFANDRRITAGKGLTAGTFATTREDADANVKTGAEAVARYALPTPKPASNVFTILPPADVDLKRGVAQPANNQPGGGVEVIFVTGLPDGTVTGPVSIPDK